MFRKEIEILAKLVLTWYATVRINASHFAIWETNCNLLRRLNVRPKNHQTMKNAKQVAAHLSAKSKTPQWEWLLTKHAKTSSCIIKPTIFFNCYSAVQRPTLDHDRSIVKIILIPTTDITHHSNCMPIINLQML